MSKAEELANRLNGLCVAEFAWPYLNDAAKELRRLSVESEMRRVLAEDSMQKLRALEANRQMLVEALESCAKGFELFGMPFLAEEVRTAIEQAKELT